jgi:hypothetical protein
MTAECQNLGAMPYTQATNEQKAEILQLLAASLRGGVLIDVA